MLAHFGDTVRVVSFADGRPARLKAVVPREVALGLRAPDAPPPAAAAAAAASPPTEPSPAAAEPPPAAATTTSASAALPAASAAPSTPAPPAPCLRLRPATATSVVLELRLASPFAAAAVVSPSLLARQLATNASTTASPASPAASASASASAAASTASAAAAPVVIVGGGIGGLAAAVALQARGIGCVVYERDVGFERRRRGYGLTLGPTCWAALADLGLEQRVRAIDDCVGSTAHWVFDARGGVLGYFGTAFSGQPGKGRVAPPLESGPAARTARHVLRARGGPARAACPLASLAALTTFGALRRQAQPARAAPAAAAAAVRAAEPRHGAVGLAAARLC
jgi:hypothetical protein